MSAIETKILVDAVPQKLHSVRRILDDYKRELADTAWQKFIEGIQILVGLVEFYHHHNLEKAINLGAADAQLSDTSKRACSKIALSILSNIQREYLPFLEQGSHQAEYVLLPSIQGIVRQFDHSAEIALVPDFKYNYSYIGLKEFVARNIEDLRAELDAQAATRLSESAAQLPNWNVFLQYPAIEDSSALNLCVLAHELAHFVDHHEGLYRLLLPDKLDHKSFDALVTETCSIVLSAPTSGASESGQQLTLGYVLSRDAIETGQYKACIVMVENWLREIIADILAVHALGPAYYFAIMEFLAHAAVENQPAETHPPLAFRLDLLADELEHLGHLKESSPITGLLQACKVRAAGEASTTEYRGQASVAHETLKEHLPSIKSKLREFMKDRSYTVGAYELRVAVVVKDLLRGYAPIERVDDATGMKEPNDVRDVFNAGWEIYKTRLGEFASIFVTNNPPQETLDNLNQLVFKAVEAGEVVRRWRAAKT